MYENSTSLDNSIKKLDNKMKRSECQLESSEKRRLLYKSGGSNGSMFFPLKEDTEVIGGEKMNTH